MSNWQIENLLNKAFIRTKQRFLSFFFAIILDFIAIVGIAILGLILAGIIFLIHKLLSSIAFTSISIILLLSLLFALWIYLSTWLNLLKISIIFEPNFTQLTKLLKKLRPKVWEYIKIRIIIFLFLLLLLPLGVISLFSIYFVWGIWLSFVPFVFLEKNIKGTKALWASKTLLEKKFLKVGGRILLVGLGIFALNLFLIISAQRLGLALSNLLSLFTTPFLLSFIYEIYRLLELKERKIRAPKVWINSSLLLWCIIGIIILFVVL